MERVMGRRWLVLLFWVAAGAAIPVWAALNVPGWGWDFRVYADTVRSLQRGHDPYLEGTIEQERYFSREGSQALAWPAQAQDFAVRPGHPPLRYLYAPVTLPVLRALGRLPERGLVWAAIVYWAIYAAGALVVLATMLRFVEPAERPAFALAAPAAVFFPGLLQHDAILGGNVAYVAYGAIFALAGVGWRTGKWRWFYAAVLAASCVKLPFLVLAAVPVLSARKQWPGAIATVGAALAVFAAQAAVWPGYFHNYLQAALLDLVHMGFGLSPAGLAGWVAYRAGWPYSAWSAGVYLAYAVPVSAVLWRLSRRFFTGRIPLSRWAPVMLIGVFLLNLRLKEYDVAPLTIPLALVLWRVLRARLDANLGARQAGWWFAAILVTANGVALVRVGGRDLWNEVACAGVAAVFAAGCAELVKRMSRCSEDLAD